MSPLARIALASLAFAEGAAAVDRFGLRKRLYARASARARDAGRLLVVVGDPDAGAHTRMLRAYGCGDVCVDLAGCKGCPVAYAVDLTAARVPSVADDSAVVFVSCVFEYVSDPQAAYREVLRMAGSPANVFVATVQPGTVTAALYPGAKWVVDGAPPDQAALSVRPVTAARKAAYGGAIAALVYASF